MKYKGLDGATAITTAAGEFISTLALSRGDDSFAMAKDVQASAGELIGAITFFMEGDRNFSMADVEKKAGEIRSILHARFEAEREVPRVHGGVIRKWG